MAINAQLQRELQQAVRNLDKLAETFEPNERKKVLRESAKLMQEAYVDAVPSLKKGSEHYRYLTAKVNKRLRAPKGMGEKVATYKKGNLKRSIKVLSFRKSADVFVGPRVLRGDKAKGVFNSKSKADGFYLWFLEKGTKHLAPGNYIKKAFNATAAKVAQDIIKRSKDKVKKLRFDTI